MKYRLINKSDNKIKTFSKAHDVAIWMLGRSIAAYVVIKSCAEKGDRLVTFTSPSFNDIEKELEEA